MYKLVISHYLGQDYQQVVCSNSDGLITSIPDDPANTDYQQYLKWLAEGNQPLPPDEPTQGATQ